MRSAVPGRPAQGVVSRVAARVLRAMAWDNAG
jgi:hypothetical protein